MKPVINQAAISHPADPKSFSMSAETIKIPEPIIDPATIIVASHKPSTGLNFVSLMKSTLVESVKVVKKSKVQSSRFKVQGCVSSTLNAMLESMGTENLELGTGNLELFNYLVAQTSQKSVLEF